MRGIFDSRMSPATRFAKSSPECPLSRPSETEHLPYLDVNGAQEPCSSTVKKEPELEPARGGGLSKLGLRKISQRLGSFHTDPNSTLNHALRS